MKVRLGVSDDAGALGVLIAAALTEAPSSLIELSEIGQDLALLGRDLLGASMDGSQPLFVATDRTALIGAARLSPREFARSSHVASIALLVSPRYRGRGVARALMAAVLNEARETPSIERLELVVADNDVALKGLAEAFGFDLERVERGGIMTADGLRDLLIYARDPT